MKIRDVAAAIEEFAPLGLQESYDNAGLAVGRPDAEVHKALLAVDVTEEVIEEAAAEGCDIIITHHPVIFHPLKRLNSASYTERCVEQAVRRGIALYAAHTNLDSTPEGMSWRVGHMLGLESMRVLEPAAAGGGAGFGVVGELPTEEPTEEFMRHVMRRFGVQALRHGDIVRPTVRRVAICTGAGAFRHQGTGPDDAVFAHNTVVEQGGVHPDEAAVPYGAAVHQCAVPYRDVFAKGHAAADVAVQHRVVLYVAVFADGQCAVIPAQHRAVPDGGAGL